MPRLRTDDGPRKLRAVWLGPAGHTLPFWWTYVQWAVTLIAVPVFGTIGTAVVWLLLGDPVWALGIGGLWCAAAGMWLAVRMMRNVTFDEPLRYQFRLIRGELTRQFSRPVGPRRIAVHLQTPPIGYLSAAVRSSMGWDITAHRPLSPTAADLAASATMPAEPNTTGSSSSRPNPYLSNTAGSPAPAAVQPQLEGRTRPRPTNPYLTAIVPVADPTTRRTPMKGL